MSDPFIRIILNTKNFKASESITIFSEARGGSSWLAEILSDIVDVCINWEPLYVSRGVVPNRYNFGWRPYIPKEEVNEEYLSLFTKIHEYKAHTFWTRSYLTIGKAIRGKQVLVKYVRANLLVPYLMENLDFKFPPVFLLRNPIDTCMSQIKTFDSSGKKAHADIPDWMNNERFVEHHDFMSRLESNLEITIAKWCLNNCPTIDQLGSFKVHVLFYEDLLADPRAELEKILVSYGIPDYGEKLNQIDFRKPSATDFKKQYRKSVDEQLNKNFRQLDDQTKDKIQNIYDHFGFKLYSAYSPLPDKKALLGV